MEDFSGKFEYVQCQIPRSVVSEMVNIGRGAFRLYLVFWLFYALLLLSSQYKELATFAGIETWSIAGAKKEAASICESAKFLGRDDINCHSFSGMFISDEEAKAGFRNFIQNAVFEPSFLLIAAYLSVKLIGWALRGFRERR